MAHRHGKREDGREGIREGEREHPGRTDRIPATGARLLTALADQAVSGLTNICLLIVAARTLSASAFGVVSLGYALMTFTLAVSRASLGTPLLLRLRADKAAPAELGHVGTAALLSGGACGVLITALLLAEPDGGAAFLVALALASPLIMLQDVGRHSAAASGEPAVALRSDLWWLVGSLAAVAVSFSVAAERDRWSAACWLAAVVLSLVPLLRRGHVVRPRLRGAAATFRADRRRWRLGLNASISGAAALVTSAITLVFAGAATAAALRGAATLFAPLNVLIAFATFGLLPEATRRRGREVQLFGAAAASIAVIALGWGVVVTSLGTGLGTSLLGDTWTGALPVLRFTTAEYAALVVFACGLSCLIALDRAGDVLLVRAVFTIATLIAVLVLATTQKSATSIAAGLVGSAVAAGLLTWIMLLRRTTRHR